MKKLIVIIGIFVLMLAVQINFTPVAGAFVSIPQAGALVCEYKSSNASYRVAMLDLGEDVENVCPLPLSCDKNDSCTGCLNALSYMGYEVDSINKVTGKRAVYTLINDDYVICED